MPPKPPRYVLLPNGSYLEWPENVSADEFNARARQILGEGNARGTITGEVASIGQAPSSYQPKPYRPYQGSYGERALSYMGEDLNKMMSHPLETLKGIIGGASPVIMANPADMDLKHPLDELKKMIPGANMYRRFQMDPAAPAGDLGAAAIPALVMHAADMLPNIGKGGIPELAPEEAARNLTRAINPPPQEWNSHIRAEAAETGNIQDFAKQNNLPLKTQLDYAKAARASAEAENKFLHERLIDPYEKDRVNIDPLGHKQMTIGEIDKRIDTINDELRPDYVKNQSGKVRTATDEELKAELGQLTDVLHKELGKRAGVAPEEIAALRQRIGKKYTIADQTLAKVNSRQSAVQNQTEGGGSGIVKPTSLDRVWSAVRGGPERISNRAYRKALRGTRSIPGAKMPDFNPPGPPATTPPTIWRNAAKTPIASRPPWQPSDPVTTSPEEVAAHLEKLQSRVQDVLQSRNKTQRRPFWSDLMNKP